MPTISSNQLVSDLRQPRAYAHAVGQPVALCETHISWVFLAGEFAYKVKKPVKNAFLDYSTLGKRKHFCEEELRLDRRYARELYLDVVPIVLDQDHKLRVDGGGEAVEYAVKMHRFPDDALLSHRLSRGIFSSEELQQLATAVALFHQRSAAADRDAPWGKPALVLEDALDNFRDLDSIDLGEESATLHVLKQWTHDFFCRHEDLLAQRLANRFIRECHGDLHLANVIDWRGQMLPFDGIEFNDRFRWIDVLSDAAFLAMDFAARDHLELSRSFINAYLERTGDHASLPLLRWYLVYRSLVRAKVDALKMAQEGPERAETLALCRHHVQLAYRFSLPIEPTLWITHGVSGSGKTTGSEWIVRQHGAIRLRSDLERKRHFGMDPWSPSPPQQREKLYSKSASVATYCRLRQLAHTILQGGDSVVVDATFLRRKDRESFHQLADCLGVSFALLDFTADEQTLRQRVADRIASGDDVSEADLRVLQSQLELQEPLTDQEQRMVTELPPPAAASSALSTSGTYER